jgi:SulP family sulfate permease
MVGFTTGATLLIAASQLPTLVGVERGDAGLLAEAWSALTSPGDWHLGSLGLGIAAVLVIEVGRRFGPRVPGVLIAVIGAILVSSLAGFDGTTVGEIPAGIPGFGLDLPWDASLTLLVPALVIAFVGFTEAAAISSVFAAEDRERWDPNREFVSQGVANLASSVSGGFPVGGSFSRSSVNRLAGAKTRWSGAVTGIAVFAFFPAAGILEPLPTAVLAAIVIAAVARLIRPQEIVPIWRQSRLQGGVAAFTLAATLILSPRIDLAVLLGIGLAVLVHLGRELSLTVEVDAGDGILRIAPRGVIFFGSTPRLLSTLLSSLAEHPEVDRLVIDLGGTGRIDFTGADALRIVALDARAAGLEVEFENVPAHARRIVTGVVESLE